MPLDPEAPENRSSLSPALVNQSDSEIHHKLQRLEGFEGKRLAEIIALWKKCLITERPWKKDRPKY